VPLSLYFEVCRCTFDAETITNIVMKVTTTNFSIFLITVLTVALITMTVYEKDKVGDKGSDRAMASTQQLKEN
jgi:hypothetical protein